MKKLIELIIMALIISGCKSGQDSFKPVSDSIAQQTAFLMVMENNTCDPELIQMGVMQTAALWDVNRDGSEEEFSQFCKDYFVSDASAKKLLYERITSYLESINGHFDRITLALQEPVQIVGFDQTPVDELFAGYSVYSHLNEDFFENKIAFVTKLNFPFFTLEQKNERGQKWTRLEWAYARLGDYYTDRVPSSISQAEATAQSKAEIYISNYNIKMGSIRNEKGEALFPEGMSLLAHWNLRDQLKSEYPNGEKGLEKQRMIYDIMKHIVVQDIPQCVIDNGEYEWYPVSNRVMKNGEEVQAEPEPCTRYRMLLDQFNVQRLEDEYNSLHPTYIERALDSEMEITFDELEEMFTSLISSPQVKKTAQLIRSRLGRDLEPFDLWYDGFRARSSVSAEELDRITSTRYPDTKAFAADMPRILSHFGFSAEKAAFIASKVEVDPAVGSGHAWGSQMREANSHLRTRIVDGGMDYLGYNIAAHEFGHNVEQTISMQDVDYYTLRAVPNTAFTEANAFVFQVRDLELLGYSQPTQATDMNTLDIFWGAYEIMGVALVDMYTWKWLYANPDATPQQLRDEVVSIAKNLWNKYYAPYLGEEDSPILGIYSHMIEVPLYLPNYPFGHIIEFQLEQQYEGKNIADEMLRIYSQGRLTPQIWMQGAVGDKVSIEPLLAAADKAVDNLAQ